MAKRNSPQTKKAPAGLDEVEGLVARDPAAALEALVAAWRAHRLPELAALVARTGRLAARGRPPITGTRPAELQAAWMATERAGDPVDLDRLLDALCAGVCDDVKLRLGRLAARDEDPRLLAALVAIVTTNETHPNASSTMMRGATQAALPFTSAPNRSFWTALFNLLDKIGDATVVEELMAAPGPRFPTKFGEWLKARVAPGSATIEALAARTVAPATADEKRAMARIGAALDAIESVGAKTSDSRGELIALQMARHQGTITSDGKKREKELLTRHKKQWLGPIAPLIQPYNIRFERGFIVTCQLEPNAALETTLGEHPAWSTIREFLVHDYAKTTGRALAKMLESRGAVRTSRFTRGIE